MDLANYRPTLSEVAALFGKSSRWISDLRAKGEMPPDNATLAEFFAAWGSLSAGQSGSRGKAIDQHKVRLAAAKADQAEMERDEQRGLFLPRQGIDEAMRGAFARVRAKLIGLPAKAAPMIASLKGAVPIQDKLTELVHEALRELAATVAHPIAPLVVKGDDAAPDDAPGGDAGDSGGGDDVVAGVHAAPAPDGEPVGGPNAKAKPRGKRRAGPVGDGAG